MKTFNKFLMAALCTSAMTTPAFAQDEAQETEVFDENVIIVTATRRAQDVQDIPLAVTAVSPVQLERQGVVSVGQITNVSSSFSASNAQLASGSVVLRIRGVGTTSNNIGFESAVGIFVDGAYQSRPGVALSEFVDVERVEVLRGPQGTLFGRNTSAGALNITNVRPDLNDFGGFANATYGNRDLMSIQGAVNVPLVEDTLALRVTGAYRERDGYVTVVDGSGTEIGESNGTDQYLVRGQLGFETDGGISGRLIADYSKSTAGCCAAVEVLQSPLETAGLFAAVGLGARGGMAAPVVAVNSSDTTSAEAAASNRIATANFAPQTRFDQWGITGEIEVPLGDSADLIYIGSYREYDAAEAYDSDFSALDVFNVTDNRTSIETMTHELRIQGEAFGGALNWLVGGYYSTEDISQSVSFALGADYDQLVGAIIGGATGGASLNPASPIFFGATPLQNLTGFNPDVITNNNQYAQNSKSWSIFTHNTLEVTDGLELTLGLRYSDESKDGSFASGANNNPVCPAIVGQISPGGALSGLPAALQNAFFGLGCFAFTAPADAAYAAALPTPRTFSSKFSDTELIYTGKVAYAFADPVNIYASFTHGYKSGGFNLDSTAAAGGADPRFLSEEVDAYEIGLKAKFLDNAVTLNLAAFREEFSNFQVLEFTGAQFQTFNVPKAETQGVEIETTIRPSDHFTVNAAMTIIDASYPDDCAGTQTSLNVLALCGNSLTNAPDIVGIVGATYTNDIGNNLKYFLNAQVRLEGDQRTSTQAVDPSDLASMIPVPFDTQDGNVKINLRAGIGSQDDVWGIEAFVTNLTNEVTRGVTFNTVLRSGSRSAFVQEPRSYGLTLRGKF
ncbi:TonB-dependent receptor [uncultured Parasphingorhabdus sp.]|uniref:TonB-dependent receptor n=1 Tax=uncultured Parasphingorhabdus sp. TaxID=2709694 RepID=UPI0030D6D97C|tara:strand:- start:34100 stop:36643 length:2544 start_codon:yes stop_codon:yes gene_type:complete